ncbi:MAG: hypothetical protein R3B84_24845 [Zavarzinella sp.]
MHFRLFVTATFPLTESSQSVREQVYDQLVNDESFCGSGGRFGTPLCDWFVIGGRWSGLFSPKPEFEAYRNAIRKQIPSLAHDRWSEKEILQHRDTLEQVWKDLGGQDCSPYFRNSTCLIGYDDDAFVLDQATMDRWLEPYLGTEIYRDASHCEFVDLDEDLLLRHSVGQKWLIIIDYHS